MFKRPPGLTSGRIKNIIIFISLTIVLIAIVVSLNIERSSRLNAIEVERLRYKEQKYREVADELFFEYETAGYYRGIKESCNNRVVCDDALAGKYDDIIDQVGLKEKWSAIAEIWIFY